MGAGGVGGWGKKKILQNEALTEGQRSGSSIWIILKCFGTRNAIFIFFFNCGTNKLLHSELIF